MPYKELYPIAFSRLPPPVPPPSTYFVIRPPGLASSRKSKVAYSPRSESKPMAFVTVLIPVFFVLTVFWYQATDWLAYPLRLSPPPSCQSDSMAVARPQGFGQASSGSGNIGTVIALLLAFRVGSCALGRSDQHYRRLRKTMSQTTPTTKGTTRARCHHVLWSDGSLAHSLSALRNPFPPRDHPRP